jgi:hypothetical protein
MARASKELSFWWFVFGAVSTGASLISFVQQFFRVPLSSFLRQFVEFYQKITYPFVDIVVPLYDVVARFTEPKYPFNKDLFILSVIGSACGLRAEAARAKSYKRARPEPGGIISWVCWSVFFLFMSLVTYIGVLFLAAMPLLYLWMLISGADEKDPTYLETSAFTLSLAAAVVCAVAFFLTNAFI